MWLLHEGRVQRHTDEVIHFVELWFNQRDANIKSSHFAIQHFKPQNNKPSCPMASRASTLLDPQLLDSSTRFGYRRRAPQLDEPTFETTYSSRVLHCTVSAMGPNLLNCPCCDTCKQLTPKDCSSSAAEAIVLEWKRKVVVLLANVWLSPLLSRTRLGHRMSPRTAGLMGDLAQAPGMFLPFNYL